MSEHINLIIVGAGGTGGHLYDRVTRLAFGMNSDPERPNLNLVLIDGDDVESANLIRQNFTEDDIGINKATALNLRYEEQLGIEAKVSQDYLQSPQDVISHFDSSAQMNILIGAVDNHSTRYLFEQAMQVSKDDYNAVWIDSGNNERDGQAIVSGSKKVLQFDKVLEFVPNHEEPLSPFEKYPETFMDFSGLNANPLALSCELAAIHSPQNIAANIIAADLLFMLINKLVGGEILNDYEYRFDTKIIGISKKGSL